MSAKFMLIAISLFSGALMVPISGYSADSDIGNSKAKEFVNDSLITTKIKTELAEEKLSSLVHISVGTDKDGVVTLSGTAANRDAADKAVTIANTVKGVTAVENHIKITADK